METKRSIMPNVNKAFAFPLFILVLLAADPCQAQNQGVRGMGDSRRSAPAVRSAPVVRSAPAPSRSYSAPSRSYSAPSRSNSAPSRSYSAPSRSYTPPLTRQSVPTPSNRTSNSSYRAATRPSVTIPSSTTTGISYPGRINPTAARVNQPAYSNEAMSTGAVRGYNSLPGVSAGQTVRMPVGRTAPSYQSNGGVVVPANTNVNANPMPDGRVGGFDSRRNGVVRTGVNPTVQAGPVYINNSYSYNNRNRQNCAPRYRDCYDPYFYSNYDCRRSYRYYQPGYYPFLSYGFFVTRPYSYYDYARIDYAQPFVYGDDDYYRSAPIVDNQVASTQATAPVSLEQEMLTELSRYVDSRTKDGRFQVADPAFGNQLWNLDLTQAPAVYSIDTNHYSVIGGFEGTLGQNTIPSSVGMEFFVAREAGRWVIKDAWIVSANGIPRAKKFQSPAYPQVQTWQAGVLCPFSGKPMIPMADSGASRP